MRGWLKVRTVIKRLNRMARFYDKRNSPFTAASLRAHARWARARTLGAYKLPTDNLDHDFMTWYRRYYKWTP